MAEDRNKSPPMGNSIKRDGDNEIAAKCSDSAIKKNQEVNDDPQSSADIKNTEKNIENSGDSENDESTKRANNSEEIQSNNDISITKEVAKPTHKASDEVQEKSSLPIVLSIETMSENPNSKSQPCDDLEQDAILDREISSGSKILQKNNSESSERGTNAEDHPEESSRRPDSAICNFTEFNKEKSDNVVEEIEEKQQNVQGTDDHEEVAEEDIESRKKMVKDVQGVEEDDNDDEDEVVDDEEEETEEEPIRESSEVGIVGPPTAVRDIVNDEELGTTESSSLPNERKNEVSGNDAADVAEWIEKSRRSNGTNEPIPTKIVEKIARSRKKSSTEGATASGLVATRKSQRIITSIIRRSIKCLNKMHAAVEYGSGGTSGKKVETSEKREEDARGSPKVPQSRQNGAALPEETATAMATSGVTTERLCPVVKHENLSDAENEQQSIPMDCARPRRRSVDEVAAATSRNSSKTKSATANVRISKSEREHTRKRRSTDDSFSANSNPFAKKICFEQRERFIDSLVGTSERVTAEELASRADELRAEVQALDEMARAKELEWNEILSMRKLKEEAYLRIERRRQVVGFMESNGQLSENLPPASLSLISDWEAAATVTNTTRVAASTIETVSPPESKEIVDCRLIETSECQQRLDDIRREKSPAPQRRDKTNVTLKSSNHSNQRRTASPKQISENGRKQQQRQHHQQQHQQQQQQQLHHVDSQSLDNRQIGEGRQGPIVDVRSIIADYRLRHPETVPRRYDNDSPARTRELQTTNTTSGLINVRRGRRMRNSVNIGLGAGGAMVETGHNVDSRPSSTDSCKSNPNPSGDPNNSMSFKDVLVQFAKLSQQQGEPVKTPQNYPDVTLHPVAPSPIIQNSSVAPPQHQQPQQQQQTTGSLLHGILTKSQSPRPTTFSPTLARLLTAPERERNSAPPATSTPQNTQTQHLLQTYQGSNSVSISDLLSSSKARTEITITPVVNPVTPIHTSHSNNLVHVDDAEEDTSLIDERDSRINSGARDNRDERDSPPRCQGCQERAAQFVCAGCGNQWYCSRDCQVAAWDEHSEVCSG